MRRSRQSRPRYKSRLIKGRVSLLVSMLLICSSSLSDSESLWPEPRSSLILLLVLLACSLWSLSLTCNKVSLHFRVVRPGMWQVYTTAQDRRPRPHTHKQSSCKRQLWDNLFNFELRSTKDLNSFFDLNSFDLNSFDLNSFFWSEHNFSNLIIGQ